MAANIGEPLAPGRPLHLLELDQDSGAPVKLNRSALREVFDRNDIKDLPICVTSVIGAYRTGKSFLLNYMIRYLRKAERELQEGDWLGNKEEPLVGFPWRQGNVRTTLGIYVWSQPFILEREGKKVAIVLMDTQGLFDQHTDPADANTIVAISTLLSSLQIYNIIGKIDEQHLTSLELFVETGMLVLAVGGDETREKPFQELVFLVRDWIDPERYPFGMEGGQAYLQEKLRGDYCGHQPKELLMVRENIANCYEELHCCLLPYPGIKVVQTTDKAESDSEEEDDDSDDENDLGFQGQHGDIDRKFKRYLKRTVESFFLAPKVKRCGSLELTGSQMMAYAMKCVQAFEGNKVPRPESSRKVIIEQYNQMVIDEIFKEQEAFFEELLAQGIPEEEKEENIIQQAEDSSQEKFEERIKGNLQEKADFLKKINESLNRLQRGFKDKCNYGRMTEKKRKEDACMGALTEAKKLYHENMKEAERGGNQGTGNTAAHSQAAEKARTLFLEYTTDCLGIRNAYQSQLEDFLCDRLKHFEEMETLRITAQDSKARVQLTLAKDHYTEWMERKLSSSHPPNSDSDFTNIHLEIKDDAMKLLRDKLQQMSIGGEKYIQDLNIYVENRKLKLGQLNGQRLQAKQNEAKAEVQCAVEKAINKYRDEMNEVCKPGEDYMYLKDFAKRHYVACSIAKTTFQSKTCMHKEQMSDAMRELDGEFEKHRPDFWKMNQQNGRCIVM